MAISNDEAKIIPVDEMVSVPKEEEVINIQGIHGETIFYHPIVSFISQEMSMSLQREINKTIEYVQGLNDDRLLVLDIAMDKLKEEFPNHYDLTMLLYCAGFSTKQTGNIMGIAQRTVQRDWKFARAFLKAKIQQNGSA